MSGRLRWLAPLGMAGAIFALSSVPGRALPAAELFPHQDKVVHATEYAIFGALLVWTWPHALGAWLAATAYGASDELHQRWVPNRTSDPRDLLADSVGAIVGVAGLQSLRRRSARRARRNLDGDHSKL